MYAVYHSPKIEKPIGFDINIRSTNCGNQVVSPRWYRLIYHYEYDHPSRPSWLLGGTLTLSSLLTRESAVAPYIYTTPPPCVSTPLLNEEIYLLRDYIYYNTVPNLASSAGHLGGGTECYFIPADHNEDGFMRSQQQQQQQQRRHQKLYCVCCSH